MNIEIRTDADEWACLKDAEALVRRATVAALSRAAPDGNDCEVSIVLACDTSVAELNGRWRDKQHPTNVLSFPAAPGLVRADQCPHFLGDIIVAAGTVKQEASEQRKPLETHLCHLVIHGVLHLLGFDHDSDESARRMESIEIATMNDLGYGNPYETGDPAGAG